MELQLLRVLRGPNPWAPCPVVLASVNFGAASLATDQVRSILRTSVRPSATRPGSRRASRSPPRVCARALGRAALQLQDRAGTSVAFSAIQSVAPGVYEVAAEYVAETVGKAALESAGRLLRAAMHGTTPDLTKDVEDLQNLEYVRFPPNRQAAVIYEAARSLGIPWGQLHPEYRNYLRLGQGAKQQRCRGSEPNQIGCVARLISTDKYMTKHLLRTAGVPVPEGRLVSTVEEAWQAACELGLPVATKPLDSCLATGVSLDLSSRAKVEEGFRAASEHSSYVLVERFAPGLEHRVLVVGSRVAAVTRIDPPHVIGDGVHTVAELVARVNADPRRGDSGDFPLRKIKIDDVAEAVVVGQGHTFQSVPAASERVLLRRNPPYIKNGGSLTDLTDQIHPLTAAQAIAAANLLQISVAGLDVVAVDIAQPLAAQAGVVVEVNVSPGLWLHLAPFADRPRPVAEAIVASMFPAGDQGRIPVVALVGAEPSRAEEFLRGLLAGAGRCAGSVGATEVAVGDRRWPHAAGTPQERAEVLFQDPTVEVAVLHTTPRELCDAGFGNDRCEVGVVLGSVVADDALRALRHALGQSGVLVLPAEVAAARTGLDAARVFLVAAADGGQPVKAHREAGGRALHLDGETIVLSQGGETVGVGRCPVVAKEEVAVVLSALAAAVLLGVEVDRVLSSIASGFA